MNFNDFKKGLKKEFNDSFKTTKKKVYVNWFDKKYILYFLGLFIVGFLFGEHMYVQSYNNKIEEAKMEYYSDYTNGFEKGIELIKIDSTESYLKLKAKNNYTKKESILSSLLSINMGCSSPSGGNDLMSPDDMVPTTPEASPDFEGMPGDANNSTSDNSYQTNVQTFNVDESDISKCDGKYIYKYYDFGIYIFDISTENLVCKTNIITDVSNLIKNNGKYDSNYDSYYDNMEMYVKDNNIVVTGRTATFIYKFENNTITLKDYFSYSYYNDSRLVDNYLYVVYSADIFINSNENKELEDAYYDGYTRVNRIYTIIKYDLVTNEYKSVENLNSGSVKLYVSDEHFYLATQVYDYTTITLVSIFDYDLTPITAIKVSGTVLNQFSMDEYENQFRIVHTDSSREYTRWNAISIYDLTTLERIGYLDEGIGLDRHTVRSVTYDDYTCYVVTYENKDPLYEIDLTDPTNPYIVSAYQAPGYSTYLHTFTINDEKYLFGLGVLDNQSEYKISIYVDNGDTTQIGKDFIISYLNYNEVGYHVDYINYQAFNNHKALFIYNDGNFLYIGIKASTKYAIFKVDVKNEQQIVTLYKEYATDDMYSRCYLVDGKLFITNNDSLIVDNFR